MGHNIKHSKETKKKISNSRKGKCLGNKNAQGNTPWNKGLTGLKIGTKKGAKFSQKHKENLSKAFKGRKMSESNKKKLSLRMKGNIYKKGIKLSDETRQKMSNSKKERKAYQWKGDNVGYNALHTWVAKYKGKPTKCEHCGENGLKGREIHWANKSGKYLRNLNDWLRLCVKCHRKYDKAQRNLQ